MKLRAAFVILAGVWSVGVVQSAVRAEQAPATKSVWDGVFTAEQAVRGADAFSANCSSCHGADLTGDGFAPPLSGAEWGTSWNDLTVGDLFERIRISMPPDDPTAVPPQTKIDIVAHILNVNKFPAGQTALEPKTDVLNQIKIEQKK